jgi:EAL domain-containing protein (putative c-di-GMP-specific phosphodiesterase class I)
MYCAKGAGKAGYRVFDPAMQEELHLKLDMEIVLRHGADRLSERPDEAPFKLLYEPICDLATGRVVALECHLRWLHPELGLLGPRAFLPLAEEIGVATKICQWFREEACAQLQQLRSAEPRLHGLSLHIVVGKEEVAHEELINGLEYALSTARLSPSDVVVVVPEQEVMQDPRFGLGLIDNLRRLGVRIAIGEFGLGCSSITQLHTLALDYLLLGEAFTSTVGACDRQRTLVEAVLTMAKGFSFDVVTQGIKEESQVEVLRQVGCRLGQGAYYSPLLGIDDVAKFVADRN